MLQNLATVTNMKFRRNSGKTNVLSLYFSTCIKSPGFSSVVEKSRDNWIKTCAVPLTRNFSVRAEIVVVEIVAKLVTTLEVLKQLYTSLTAKFPKSSVFLGQPHCNCKRRENCIYHLVGLKL